MYALGIDVSMTPLTADMISMYDKKSGYHSYTYPLDMLIYDNDNEEKVIDFKEQSFYRLKLPSLEYVGAFLSGEGLPGTIYAVCFELNKEYGPVEKWVLRAQGGGMEAVSKGYNILQNCPLMDRGVL